LKGQCGIFEIMSDWLLHVARDIAIEKSAGHVMRWLLNRLWRRVEQGLNDIIAVAMKPIVDWMMKAVGVLLAVAFLVIFLYFGTHTARRAA
jgi:hypothetical protein